MRLPNSYARFALIWCYLDFFSITKPIKYFMLDATRILLARDSSLWSGSFRSTYIQRSVFNSLFMVNGSMWKRQWNTMRSTKLMFFFLLSSSLLFSHLIVCRQKGEWKPFCSDDYFFLSSFLCFCVICWHVADSLFSRSAFLFSLFFLRCILRYNLFPLLCLQNDFPLFSAPSTFIAFFSSSSFTLSLISFVKGGNEIAIWLSLLEFVKYLWSFHKINTSHCNDEMNK